MNNNMLRITISKIRKVCTSAFVPRYLRDRWYTPSTYATIGKFEKFTLAVKWAGKSTKASDNEPLAPENQLKNSMSVVSLSKQSDLSNIHDLETDLTDRNINNTDLTSISSEVPPMHSSASVSQYDKCIQIIAEIFGETPVALQEELLVMTRLNMSNGMDNDKNVPDRIPSGSFTGNYNSKKSFKTTPCAKKESTTNENSSCKNKDNFQSVLCYDAVLMKKKEANQVNKVQNKSDGLKPLDNQEPNNCLCDVDPEEYMSKSNIDTKALKRLTNKQVSEQERDTYWSDVCETTTENRAACYEPNQVTDIDTIKQHVLLKAENTDSKNTELISKRINHTQEELERILRGSPYDQDFYNNAVEMTTDKKKKETLEQKIEHFDETPLVETEKPKSEGFITTPKVLDNLNKPAPSINFDDVANKCLNAPQSQVDKILLKEIENLGTPITVQKASTEPVLLLSNTAPEICNTAEFNSNHLPNNLTGLGGIKLNPSTLQAEKQYWNDLNKTKSSEESKEGILVMSSDISTEKLGNKDYNDKESSSQNNVHDINLDHYTNNHGQTTTKPENMNLIEDIWGKERLEPKHVLTCNETCPISPKAIINSNKVENIEGTEAIFERNILKENEKMKKENEKMKKENDESQKLFLQIHNTYGSHKANLIKLNSFNNSLNFHVKPLEHYIKMIQRANSEIKHKEPLVQEDSAMELTKRSTSKIESAKPLQLPEITCPQPMIQTYPTMEIAKRLTVEIKSEKSQQLPVLTRTEQLPLVVPRTYIQEMTGTLIPIKTREAEFVKENTINPSEKSPVEKSTEILMEDFPKSSLDTKSYTDYEYLKNNPRNEEEDMSSASLVKTMETTSEQLQATTEQLQATSEKLEIANEKLNKSTEQLQNASDQLQATSEQLQATTKKLEVASEKIYETSEQLQATSVQLDATYEKIDQNRALHTHSDEISSKKTVDSALLVDLPAKSTEPVADPLINPDKAPNKPPAELPKIPTVATINKAKYTELDNKENLADSSSISSTTISSTLPVAEGTSGNIKLSELMKIVKERNRLLCYQEMITKEVEAKKPVLPLSLPRHNPPVFKLPSYPKIKPRPRACPSPRRRQDPKKTNFSQCDLETLGLDHDLGAQFSPNKILEDNILQQGQVVALAPDGLPSADLTDEVLHQLQYMGNLLDLAYQRGKHGLETAALAKTRLLFTSKSYEPWTPIPSWPLPKKNKRQKLQCPKHGCPIPPPRSVHDPHCGLKPCSTFPTYPKRKFALLDYLTISVG